jgi:DNA polymerase III epsilon subunit family exonuclease
MPCPDVQRGTLPAPEPQPDPDAERAIAVAAAARHLERWARRARRAAAAALPAELDRPLDAVRYCVIDTETTGQRPDGSDEILEIGAVRVVDAALDRTFTSLVCPLGPITAGAASVHGIGAAAVAGAPPITAVLPYFLEMARDCVLVFHNAPFDLGFLQRALADAARPLLASPVIDTLVVSRRLLAGRCGLGALGRRLGLEAPHLHRALPDAELTAHVLLQLLDCLRAAGATRLAEVPGITVRPPRLRRGPRSRRDVLLERLEQAKSRGEVVQVSCLAGRGVAPIEVRLRFLAVAPGACIVREADTDATYALDPASIVRLETLA